MPRILRTPWTNQPPRAVGIDRNDLIGRHVLVAVADGVDVASDRPLLTAGAGLTRGVGAHGAQVSHASTSGSTDAIYTPQSHFEALTIFTLCKAKAATGNSIVSTGGIGFKTSASGSPYFRLLAYINASTPVIAVSSVVANDSWRFLVGTWDGASEIKLYADGVLAASATGVSTIYAAIKNFTIGNFASGNLDGAVALSGVLNRALSAAEVAEFSRNPWRIMVPTPQRVYFDLGAGGAITGTISFTEDNDTLAASGKIIHRATASFTEDNDTLAATGRLIHYGSVAFTEDDDTLAASGSVGSSGVSGTVAFTEDDDTLSAAGRIIHRGTISFTEDDDTLAASDTDPLHGFTQDQLDFLVAYMEANMAIPTASEIATAIYANTIDGKTLTQHIRLLSAVLGGKVSGAGTGTETFRDIADTVDRVVATVDSSGNRTAITLDLD